MQLPWVTAPENRTPELLGSIGESLVGAAKAREEKQRYAAAQLRQQKLDEQQAQLHAAQIANYESEAAQRAAQAEEQKKLRQAAAVKDIQASLDAGKIDEAKLKAAQYKIELGDAPQPISQQPGNTVMAPTNRDLTAPPGEGESTTDVMAANQAAIAQNQPLAPKKAPYTIGGQKYDPEQTKAAEQAQREETAARVGKAYEPLGYGSQASALALGDTGKAADIDTLIAQRMKADQSDKERRELLGLKNTFTTERDERNKLTRQEQIDIAAAHDRAKIAGGIAAGGGARTDQANLAAYKYADNLVKDGAKELGLPKLNETLNLFDIAQEELKKDSGAAQIGARMVAERALRGGPPTQYMDQQEASHLGGLWARFTGAIQTAANGQLGDEQRAAISQEIDAARQQYIAARDRRLAAIRDRIQSEPGLENLHGTANARFKQTAEGMGAKAEDIFPGEGNALPPVGAGSVAATKQAAPKAKPTVGDTLKSAGKKKSGGESDEARKKRLLMELSDG